MTIAYQLAPIPKWVIIGTDGETAGGAKLYTKSSLNPTQNKAVYQDPAGLIPWENPILFDLNGTQGPFYWESDTANPTDLYFLEAFDSDNNLLWTLNNYTPPGSGGGGGGTTYAPLSNMIANNVFIDHVDDIAAPTNLTNQLIAPSNHHGFTPDLINPVIGTNGAVGPDIRFVKNDTGVASDQITFVDFSAGANEFGTLDVVPVQYLRYQCSGTPAGESYKSFQFPICQKVENLEDNQVTLTCWAKVTATPVTLSVYVRQYFGSGGAPSSEVYSVVGTMALTTAWTKFNIQFTVPNIGGKTLGTCGDDALYVNLSPPLGQNCDIQFTKPALYLGTLSSFADFQTYDQIDQIIQSPRTGDIKTSVRSAPPRGWIAMDDRTIGSATSGATNTNGANINTFPLYKTIWDAVSDTYAPVTTGRGASAVADFAANKSMRLTRALGRVLAGNGIYQSALTFSVDTATDIITVASNTTLITGTPILVSNSGGGLPAPLVANTPYYVINLSATTLKLALSEDLAIAGTAIDLTTAGSGTNTILNALGATFGEGVHTLTVPEMPSHTHDIQTNDNALGDQLIANNLSAVVGFTKQTLATGGGLAHNTMQPTAFYNVFIKL